jgi:hypothetical protein
LPNPSPQQAQQHWWVWMSIPLVMMFWVNVHGSFVLGLALLGLTLVGETLTTALRLPRALPWKLVGILAMTTVATAAATLVNPLGIGIYQYVWSIAANPTIRAIIQEWQPPLWYRLSGASFYCSLVVVVVVGVVRWQRLTLAHALLLMAFAALALTSLGMVFWYTLVTIPIVAQLIANPIGELPQRNTATRNPSTTRRVSNQPVAPPTSTATSVPRAANSWHRRWAVPLLVGIGVLGFCLVQPPMRTWLPLHRLVNQDVIDVPGAPGVYSNDTPVAAIDYVRQHPRPGRIFNDVGVGSYLIWARGTEQSVFMDTRIELFSLALWQEYLAIGRADDYNARLIDTYDIRRVLLNKADQPLLLQALASDPLWQEEFSDRRIAIYRRALP